MPGVETKSQHIGISRILKCTPVIWTISVCRVRFFFHSLEFLFISIDKFLCLCYQICSLWIIRKYFSKEKGNFDWVERKNSQISSFAIFTVPDSEFLFSLHWDSVEVTLNALAETRLTLSAFTKTPLSYNFSFKTYFLDESVFGQKVYKSKQNRPNWLNCFKNT